VSLLNDHNARQLADGAGFVLDAPEQVPAIMGHDGGEVLWSEGESLLIVGPPGVGKGTLLQQIALRRAGVLDGPLIGLPVKADRDSLTVYLALDRPPQIARSFRRMVTREHEGRLEQLATWRGPLPFNVAHDPEQLAAFVLEIAELRRQKVGSLFIDSLKDMAAPLSSDDVGSAVNRAIACVLAEGIEVAVNHHGRKATSENKRPNKLADVFGSVWITGGAGSVVGLFGEPGDPVVELTHLKSPAEEVGPFTLTHDHAHGITTRGDRADVWSTLQHAAADGITATDGARATYGPNATRGEIEKARRTLDRLVTEGKASKTEGTQAGAPTIYRPTSTVEHREGPREGSTPATRTPTNRAAEPHAPLTLAHTAAVTAPSPLKGGERDGTMHDHLTPDDAEKLAERYPEIANG
jgi:replicative DNA helicase